MFGVGPLHDPVTWYKITHACEQVAQWDFHNNATCTSPPEPAFVLEVPLCNLLTSMCDFVPCDWIMQRAYCYCPHQPNVDNPPDHGTINGLLNPGETILCQTLWETIDKCLDL